MYSSRLINLTEKNILFQVTNWTIVKTALWFTDTLNITFSKTLHNFSEEDTKNNLRQGDMILLLQEQYSVQAPSVFCTQNCIVKKSQVSNRRVTRLLIFRNFSIPICYDLSLPVRSFKQYLDTILKALPTCLLIFKNICSLPVFSPTKMIFFSPYRLLLEPTRLLNLKKN